MSWINERIASDGTVRWKLLERLPGSDGRKKTTMIISNIGNNKTIANIWKVEFDKAVRLGFAYQPPITVQHIQAFLKAKQEGKEPARLGARMTIEEFCDFYLLKHGPSLEGGISTDTRSPYYGRKVVVEGLKRFWKGKYPDEITKLDVRDYLAQWTEVGTVLRNLGIVGNMFKVMAEYNEEGIIAPPIKMPAYNPAKKWRKQMKAADKHEEPDSRVLSYEEWDQFKAHLKPRTLAICDLALNRYLRVSDIKKLNALSMSQGRLRGRQSKTGYHYNVPVMVNQPARYDFTNFKREFHEAQVKAGMDHPAGHPLHFSIKDLRRTGATWAWRETKDLASISAMLGHKNWSTTKRYLHITDADTSKIAAVMDRLSNKHLRERASSAQGSTGLAGAGNMMKVLD